MRKNWNSKQCPHKKGEPKSKIFPMKKMKMCWNSLSMEKKGKKITIILIRFTLIQMLKKGHQWSNKAKSTNKKEVFLQTWQFWRKRKKKTNCGCWRKCKRKKMKKLKTKKELYSKPFKKTGKFLPGKIKEADPMTKNEHYQQLLYSSWESLWSIKINTY